MNKLTIRPQIYEDESLSSFLLRLCHLNNIEFEHLLIIINIFYKKADIRMAFQIDINPLKTINICLLEKLTNISFNVLAKNTFHNLIKQFISVNEMKILTRKSSLIKSLFTTHTRKFCSVCLKENIHYKLTWQLENLSSCPIHKFPLSSNCPTCGCEQPYLHSNLTEGNCKFCNQSLATLNLIYTTKNLKYSKWLISQYEYLTSTNTCFFKEKKEWATILLYISSQKKPYFNINQINILSQDYKYNLIQLAQKKTDKDISIKFFLNLLWENKLEAKDCIQITVPNQFKVSINKYNLKKSLNICITPWCKYNNTNIKIKKIKSIRSKTHNYLHICLGCCLKFGINKKTEIWEEYGDIIKFGYNVILPLINNGNKRYTIAQTVNLSRYKVYKIVAYLARFHLINNEHINNHLPKSTATIAIKDLFKYANINETLMRKTVQKELKITTSDFYYFYYDHTLQEFLFNL